MSPHERKDVRVESKGTATSARNIELHSRRHGVCQSCRTALAQHSSGPSSEETSAGAGRGGSGTRQPRAPQSPPPGPRCAVRFCVWHAPPTPVSTTIILRKTSRSRGLLSQPGDSPSSPAPGRLGLPAQANWFNSMALRMTGSRAVAPGSPLSACRTTPPARSSPPSSSPPNRLSALSACSASCCAATTSPWLSTAIAAASSCATTTPGRSRNNWSASAIPLSSDARSSNSASPSSPPAAPKPKGRVERLWGVLQDRLTSELRLAHACDLDSANAVLTRFIADYNRRFARRSRETATAWHPAPPDLDRICCFVHP